MKSFPPFIKLQSIQIVDLEKEKHKVFDWTDG